MAEQYLQQLRQQQQPVHATRLGALKENDVMTGAEGRAATAVTVWEENVDRLQSARKVAETRRYKAHDEVSALVAQVATVFPPPLSVDAPLWIVQ